MGAYTDVGVASGIAWLVPASSEYGEWKAQGHLISGVKEWVYILLDCALLPRTQVLEK